MHIVPAKAGDIGTPLAEVPTAAALGFREVRATLGLLTAGAVSTAACTLVARLLADAPAQRMRRGTVVAAGWLAVATRRAPVPADRVRRPRW